MNSLTLSVAAMLSVGSAVTLAEDSPADPQGEDWQTRRLFQPTPDELANESDGDIFIYQGLSDDDVERAMEQEFDRIESMMFIRIRKPKPDGGYEEVDDGC